MSVEVPLPALWNFALSISLVVACNLFWMNPSITRICLCCELLITQFIFPEPGYEFDRASLLEYNPMSFGGPPVTVETVEEADELLRNDEKESAIGRHLTI